MAEVAPTPVDPPAAKPKKKSAPKTARNRGGPTIKDLIVKIVAESKDRKGMSTALLKKNLSGKGYDVEKNKARIRIALMGLVEKNILNQTTGVGASGSFKLAKKTGEPKKKKSAAASKTTPVKKPAPKKRVIKTTRSPGKVKTASKKKNSPTKKVAKKVSKPAAAKKAASGKSRKGAAPKSPRVKKAAKKATAAKKTSKPKVRKAAAKK